MGRTIAVFGAGPGMGRSVAHRFGREGYRVALVARTPERLAAFAAELAADGVEADGFTADLADRAALPGVVDAINARFGHIDVLEYAPAGPYWMDRQVDVRAADAEAFEFPLDLLLRTPVTLIRLVLPGMVERGAGAVLFGLPVCGVPFPHVANVCVAGEAARTYLRNLHAGLADTGVYAGLVQVAGMVGDSDSALAAIEKWGAEGLPKPLDPADLADAMWDLVASRDRFEETVGSL